MGIVTLAYAPVYLPAQVHVVLYAHRHSDMHSHTQIHIVAHAHTGIVKLAHKRAPTDASGYNERKKDKLGGRK